jgi:hypothetical protein
MVYDSEDDEEAELVGEGPAIHHPASRSTTGRIL